MTKAPATPAPATAATPIQPAAPSHVSMAATVAPSTPSPAGAATSPTTETPSQFNDPSALTIGAQRAEAIANLESMGFPRSQIDVAMRAAFYNPDRAVEYLLNVRFPFSFGIEMLKVIQGIPENIQHAQRRAAPSGGAAQVAASPPPAAAPGDERADEPVNLFEAAAQAGAGGRTGGAVHMPPANPFGVSAVGATAGAAAGAAAAGAATGGLGNLDWLRNNPQFQQLRQVVQQQPQMLEPILQSVGAGNPQLAHLIGQHPDQFLQLLGEDGDDDVPLPPGAQAISVTEEEREAIERVSFITSVQILRSHD